MQIAEKVLNDHESCLRAFKRFGEDYTWAEEAYIRMGRIALEPRYYTTGSDGRLKVIREVIADILKRFRF